MSRHPLLSLSVDGDGIAAVFSSCRSLDAIISTSTPCVFIECWYIKQMADQGRIRVSVEPTAAITKEVGNLSPRTAVPNKGDEVHLRPTWETCCPTRTCL